MDKVIQFSTEDRGEFTIVRFELVSGLIEPADLQKVHPPSVDGTKGVVLSGRGPIWLYGFLAHHYHPCKFVAAFDPRLGGGVVFESHTSEYHVGQIVK